MKLAADSVTHKSDVGGVVLGLASDTAVSDAYAQMMERVDTDVAIDGVYIQKMIPDGQQVVVGVVQDPQFGPMLMFGSGGVEVEGLDDVAFALAPLTSTDIEYLLSKTWAGRKLDGYRNLLPADKTAVIDTLYRLGQLAADFPQLAEIEINPLLVMPQGEGVWAVDVRARMTA